MSAAIPRNESERLAALRSCGVLDSEPEPSFDEVAKLAAQLCDTPIALVSLVDAHRQWFKAKVGLEVSETSRSASMCAYSVLSGEPLIVKDTLVDARFVNNPLVTGDPHIRFYAGVPLVLAGGLSVGTLCVIDRVPRVLTSAQLDALAMLARQVATELELRRRLSRRDAPARVAPAGRTADDTVASVPIGSLLGHGVTISQRYRLGPLLGAGGMGVVFEADDLRGGGKVAIKFLLRHKLDDPEALERFVREARSLLKVEGEHVVRVIDVGDLPTGAPYIVMERLAGEDLGTRLKDRGPSPPDVVIDQLLQACTAVASAHACGIVHRDLKPANLYMAEREGGPPVLKVLDFGIAKLRQGDREERALTADGAVLGSIHYMAPEQMMSADDVDGRADIWSLGVILYQLLTGELPFAGRTIAEVCTQVLLTPRTALRVPRPELPACLREVIARCLQRDRDERYADVEQLAAALSACRGAG